MEAAGKTNPVGAFAFSAVASFGISYIVGKSFDWAVDPTSFGARVLSNATWVSVGPVAMLSLSLRAPKTEERMLGAAAAVLVGVGIGLYNECLGLDTNQHGSAVLGSLLSLGLMGIAGLSAARR